MMKPLNIAKYLNSQKVIEGYLKLCFKDSDPRVFLRALNHAIEAKGMHAIAEQVGMNPQTIQDALDPAQTPSFEIVHKVLRALNVKLNFSHRSRSPHQVISHSDNISSSQYIH